MAKSQLPDPTDSYPPNPFAEIGDNPMASQHTAPIPAPRDGGSVPASPHISNRRNIFLTVLKYILATGTALFAVASFSVAADPAYTATKPEFIESTLTGLILIIPPIWFFTCEIIDRNRLPKTGKRIRRFFWVPLLTSVALVGIFLFSPSGTYGHHLSSTGDFKNVLANHDEAKQECLDSVLNRAKYPASAAIDEINSGIRVATSGELAVHSFAGTVHFPNGFGVLNEYVFLCERAQDARDHSGYASEVSLSHYSTKVEEKDLFTPVPAIHPSGSWEAVETDEILGFESVEIQPDDVYIFVDESNMDDA